MKRFDVMRHFSEGFIAGITPSGCNPAKNEHWQAGYLAGYRAKSVKNAALDAYLISTGREPQATIRLANPATGEPLAPAEAT